MVGLVDAKGMEIKTKKIAVIKFGEFEIPMMPLKPEEQAKTTDGGIRPDEMLREMRAMYREMHNRFNFLAIGLAQIALENPKSKVKELLDSAGLVLTDFNGKTIYSAGESPPKI